MKYSNSDLPHVWAHQHEQSGSNHGGTFFFEGCTIYSYGYHFPIARLLPAENVVLMTTDGYSSTTAQHVAKVRHAIGEHLTIIYVSNITTICRHDIVHNYEQCAETIRKTIAKASRARQNKTRLIHSAIEARDNLKKYIELFNIKGTDLSEFDGLVVDEEKAAEYLKGIKERAAAKIKEKLDRWLKGEAVSLGNNPPFKVRLIDDGKQLETTHGIKCDSKVIPVLWAIMQRVKAGKDYTLPGDVERWSPVRIGDDSTLIIGCHRFPFSECKRITGVYDRFAN